MHFSAFFRFMEGAEHTLLRSLGYSINSKTEGEAIGFPRVAASCQYHSPAHCEEVLDIDVTVHRVGTKSVTYGFQFSHEGRDIATGEMTGVCCRFEFGRPPESIAIPNLLAEKLRQLTSS